MSVELQVASFDQIKAFLFVCMVVCLLLTVREPGDHHQVDMSYTSTCLCVSAMKIHRFGSKWKSVPDL